MELKTIAGILRALARLNDEQLARLAADIDRALREPGRVKKTHTCGLCVKDK